MNKKVKRRYTSARDTAIEVPKKPPLSGVMFLNSPEWREWVRKRMSEHPELHNNNRLAKKLNVTRTTIGNILGAQGVGQSRLVPRITEVLGGAPPTQSVPSLETATMDELRALVVDGWGKLDDDSKRIVADLVTKLTRR